MSVLRRPSFALFFLLMMLLYGLVQGFMASLPPLAQGVLW